MDKKQEANKLFSQKKYDDAVTMYLDALAQLPARPNKYTLDDDATLTVQRQEASLGDEEATILLRSQIYSNLSLCYIKLSQYSLAVNAASESLLDNPTSYKALHRRALANESLADWTSLSSALQDQKSLLANPSLPFSSLPQVRAAISRLEPLVAAAADKEKDEMLEKLRGIGDSLLGKSHTHIAYTEETHETSRYVWTVDEEFQVGTAKGRRVFYQLCKVGNHEWMANDGTPEEEERLVRHTERSEVIH